EVGTEHLAEISVKLIDKRLRNRSAAEIARSIKLMLESDIPALQIRPIDINLLGLRDDDAVQVSVTSPDKDKLYTIADTVRNVLEKIPGVVEVTTTSGKTGMETELRPDRIKMQLLAINPLLAGATLRTAVYGNEDVALSGDENDVTVRVQISEKDKESTAELLNLTMYNEQGQIIRLDQFIRMEEAASPDILERTNRTPSVTIKSQVIGRTGGQVNSEFREAVGKLETGNDVLFIYGGQTKRTREGITTMIAALAASILLVYFVLVVLYDSFRYPFVVLFSIPMAMIGALLALALTMEGLSVFSILGLVMLVGLVGKNAILVVDFARRLQQEGHELSAALVEATRLRFRPILMTNLSMIIGLLPIALAAGAGSEWKNGLAWVIIGGLSSSMLLTLIVVPVMYTLIGGSVSTNTASGITRSAE
ncbi:MAG: efflux RND transporter permease subunit, partial [Cyclobacteriaceae bacterium]